MIFAVISDIHANLEALTAVLVRCGKEQVEKIYCLGDIIGYGPNPRECLLLVQRNCQRIVRGNHDHMVSEIEEHAQFIQSEALISLRYARKLLPANDQILLSNLPFMQSFDDFTLAHSNIFYPELWTYALHPADYQSQLSYLKTRIGVIGHTHKPFAYSSIEGELDFDYETGWQKIDPKQNYIFNAGSVGQPRNGLAAASVLIFNYIPPDISYRFILVPYKIDTTAQKIIAAGLPNRLAERLYAAI